MDDNTSAVPAAHAKSRPGQSLLKSTPGKSLKLTPGQSLLKSTPGQSLLKSTPGQSLLKSTPGQSLLKSTPGQSLLKPRNPAGSTAKVNEEEEEEPYLIVSPLKVRPESVQRKSVCAVAVCKKPYPPGTKFHAFPRDKAQSKLWEIACKRQDKFKPENARVCSQHFSPQAYERNLKFEKKHNRLRLELKKGAVPTLKLHPNQTPTGISARDKRYSRRIKLDETEQEQEDEVENFPEVASTQDDYQEAPQSSRSMLEADVRRLQDKVTIQDKKIADLQRKVNTLQKRLRRQKVKNAPKMSAKARTKMAQEVVQQRFSWSKQQLELLSGKKRTRWSSEDIVLGLTMRGISRRLYQFLRSKKLLPLPSLATLRQHVKDFKCLPGFQEDVLQGNIFTKRFSHFC